MAISETQLLYAGALVLGYGVYRLAQWIYRDYTSEIRYLPGPKSPSFLFGHLREIWAAENSVLHEKWVEEYGSTIQYSAQLGTRRLYTVDTKALRYVLANTADYEKPEATRANLSDILGPGLLFVEGDVHKKQRRVMNPAFGPAQIRELTDIFVSKSIRLRDIWNDQIPSVGGTARIDAMSWLSRATLDIIGLAGFNYKFNGLNPDNEPSELSQALNAVLSGARQFNILLALQIWFPSFHRAFRHIRPNTEREAQLERSQVIMHRIGKELLDESKVSLSATGEKGNNWGARDLLSLLLRANMNTDLAEAQRMKDEDVIAQVPTFMVAGHETTSTATTWALFALTQNPAVQSKLRDELLTLDTDNPSMDELNALPYLDAVVREVLRLFAPVGATMRVAMKDDILPLNEPYTDTQGNIHDGIKVSKGQTIFIPILVINRSKALWGADAAEFKPERWEKIPEAVSAIPGVWGNMMTFIGGPRSCIGYRFSLVEMKAILYTLVRAFEFELAVPATDVEKKTTVVSRPVLRSDPKARSQLPVYIRQYQRK